MSRPVRTCIGCRGRADKSELLRLVWRDALVADPQQREPGRGAYLHSDPECLDDAIRRRAAGRALRVSGVDTSGLAAVVEPFLIPSEPGPTA